MSESKSKEPPLAVDVTRRSFIKTVGLSAAAGAATNAAAEARAEIEGVRTSAEVAQRVDKLGPGAVPISLNVNGKARKAEVDPTTTLLEALRWQFDLTGTKTVCDRGSCGGCSVMVDDQLVCSCMMLAIDAVGSRIETIEGLAPGEDLHPLQESFIRHDALQCGFCTPGLIMAAKALLDENPKPTMGEIRQGLSGNLCRCGTYTNVFNAVLDASGQPVPRDPKQEGA